MKSPRLLAIAALIAIAAIISAASVAQNFPPPPPPPAQGAASPGASLTQEQLDQLVAPVALYADPLLADILTASTYPLEVVEAQRWIADPANAALKGDALTTALTDQDWAASVKALVPFPQILEMMDSHLDWTQRLGEAYLAQQADVMDAVQRLRHRAESAGTLKTSPQQIVASEGDAVTISPTSSGMIYVPAYDPWCVYGSWPYPDYAPVYFSPWPGYCSPADYLIGFGAGIFLPFAFWEWGYFDWRRHELRIHRDRFERFHPGHEQAGEVWHHDPGHRTGVPYRDPRNAQRYQPDRDYHQSFRGYEGRDGGPAQSAQPAPPAFRNFAPGPETRSQSFRGESSRQGMPGGAGRSSGGSRGSSGGGPGGSSSGGRRH